MRNLTYDIFKSFYEQLSENYKSIVFITLQCMEHIKDEPSDKINYTRGFKIAMAEHGLSVETLALEIEKKTGTKELRNTIASVLYRGSEKSAYFDDILEVLEIDKEFLIENSEYYHARFLKGDMAWLFESLSEQNKVAIYFLVLQLGALQNNRYDVSKLFSKPLKDCGVTPLM